MRRFKITVIGTINKDTIIFPSGKKTESFGGILYNLSALSGLAGQNAEIYPVCNLGYDVYDQAKRILKDYDNVGLDGIAKVSVKNNHACLTVDRENQREETLRNRVPRLSFSQVKPFLDSDIILVNFISGFDVSLSALKKIRETTDASIFVDVHSLTLGVHKNGKRFYRNPRSWREYLKQADLVQANLAELTVLSGKRFRSQKEIQEFGSCILSLGPRALLITMGGDGALMMYKTKRACSIRKVTGARVRGFKDATGCGDVFSAGFIVCYLQTGSLDRSLHFANQVAAEKCRISGVEGLDRLLRKSAVRFSWRRTRSPSE
jgi:sugar/nucleoside kinase (ribokinase family)